MRELCGPARKTAPLASVWFDRSRNEMVWKLPGRTVCNRREKKNRRNNARQEGVRFLKLERQRRGQHTSITNESWRRTKL